MILQWIATHKLLFASLILLCFAYARLYIPEPNRTLMVFLGSGGHTGEMLRILHQVSKESKFEKIEFCHSKGDNLSLQKLAISDVGKEINCGPARVYEVPRARTVGQNYFSAILTSLRSLHSCIWIIMRARPAVVISNGPATGLVLLASAYAWRVFSSSNTRLIYVESFARVNELSLSGKLALKFADVVIVQWRQLQVKYPETKYLGILV